MSEVSDMPDPNTEPMPGIAAPDIHVHIMAIFHCESCDEMMVGCYTCHVEQCYGVSGDDGDMIPAEPGDGDGDRDGDHTFRRIDALKVWCLLNKQGNVAKSVEAA